jgi:hypothetical protein
VKKSWSERRDSNARQFSFSFREFPKKQSIFHFVFGADLAVKRAQTNANWVKLCQKAERSVGSQCCCKHSEYLELSRQMCRVDKSKIAR